jgi:RES domain-containing protein
LIAVWRIGYCPNPAPSPEVLLGMLGLGSTLANGRWHTQGPIQVVYAGATRALCQLEKRVHANGANPRDQALMRLDLPKSAPLRDVAELGLPADWREREAETQRIGMGWVTSGSSLGLWVPSFVEPAERNLILNPAHPDYRRIRLTIERHPFRFDPRLFG